MRRATDSVVYDLCVCTFCSYAGPYSSKYAIVLFPFFASKQALIGLICC